LRQAKKWLCFVIQKQEAPQMSQSKTFILSDESVNRYGFWVRTDGISVDAFLKNPVMLYSHNEQLLPIGKWTNIRKEHGQLLAEPEFDESDNFALGIKAKVEAGYINAASIGFDVVKTSVEPAYFKPGQTKATVTECELYEASICIIGANKGALKMGLKNKPNLSAGEMENLLPNFKNPIMKEISKVLGLGEDASETAIVLAINALKSRSENHDELATELAILKGISTEADKAVFLGKVKQDPLLGKVVLLSPAKVQTPAPAAETAHVDLAKFLNAQKDNVPGESWFDLSKKSPEALAELERSNPEKFNKLYKEAFGSEPTPMRQER
jgi:HK97 family phage prohead protease